VAIERTNEKKKYRIYRIYHCDAPRARLRVRLTVYVTAPLFLLGVVLLSEKRMLTILDSFYASIESGL
jgi:hypothetical protein